MLGAKRHTLQFEPLRLSLRLHLVRRMSVEVTLPGLTCRAFLDYSVSILRLKGS